MVTSEAHVATLVPRRYLRRLCRAFAGYLMPGWSDEHARIVLPFGACAVGVAADALVLRAEAADGLTLARLQAVLTERLAREVLDGAVEPAWRRPDGCDTGGDQPLAGSEPWERSQSR
jgi:hypothetical protein